MAPIKTIQITPSVRVRIFPDDMCSNPLEDWDHGIQLITLPDPSREWRDYTEPTSNTYDGVKPFELSQYMEDYREYANGYEDLPVHMLPSLRTELDRECAAWTTLDRNGYDGTLSADDNPDDITDHDAVAIVSRDMFRSWHGIPEGNPMPRGYRQKAAEALQGVIDEYNRWAWGECYGYQVQVHDPLCLDCMDPDDADPDPNCDSWHDTDNSCWGLIGYEYAEEEATHAGMTEAGIPIPQVTRDQKRVTLSGDGHTFAVRPQDSVITQYVSNDPSMVRVSLMRHRKELRTYMHRLSWESAQRTMRHLANR